MTQKEKLYKRYLELRNEYNSLKNNLVDVVSLTDDFLDSDLFRDVAKRSKKSELESDIFYIEISIRSLKQKNLSEEYYATDEGKKYKSVIMSRIDGVYEEIDALKNDVIGYISGFLGSDWVVDVVGSNQTEVTFARNGRYRFTFIYKLVQGKIETLSMNYPTYGTFDLYGDVDMRDYVVGLGKIVGNEFLLNNVRMAIETFVKDNEKLDKKLSNYMKRLDFPFDSENGIDDEISSADIKGFEMVK